MNGKVPSKYTISFLLVFYGLSRKLGLITNLSRMKPKKEGVLGFLGFRV
jgi:hypothetical protein